jgi:glycosyltransferase involved in cell wall biosynthesis
MGVSERKIFIVPYSVDNDRFIEIANHTRSDRAETRKRYGVPIDRPSILFAAKFTRQKRPSDLLEAVRMLNTEIGAFSVIMAGSGELETELRRFCVERGLNNVVFSGFVNQSELPALYAASDVFVLPSGADEHWGLAVNEAMCAGLPVVVSREVGCVPDLVTEGINGFTPSVGDIKALARALRLLIQDESLRAQQGKASLARISRWGHRQCLEGIRSALAGLKHPCAGASPVSPAMSA